MTAAAWADKPNWQDLAIEALGPPDPYLVWAQLTRWSYFGLRLDDRGAPAVVHRVPLLVQLQPGQSIDKFRQACEKIAVGGHGIYLPAIYADTPAAPANGPVLTLWLARALLDEPATLAPLRPFVARIEMAAPLKAHAARPDANDSGQGEGHALPPQPPPRVRGAVLFGVIDTLCPFLHSRQQSPSGTRIAAVWTVGHRAWLRHEPGYGGPPLGFAHGHAISRSAQGRGKDLDHWLQAQPTWPGGLRDEQDLALQALQPRPGQRRQPGEFGHLTTRVSHGAAVLDMLCGPVRPRDRMPVAAGGLGLDPDGVPSWAKATDVAADAQRSDVVFVDLQATQIHDSSGGWLGPQVLDGLHYIVSCANASTKHIITSISYGGSTGPHDGSSILDAALVALCAREPRLQLVLAAGNSFDKRMHALLEPQPGQPAQLQWFVPPANEKPTFMELWLQDEQEAQATAFQITSPQGQHITLQVGQVRQLLAGGQALATAIYLARTSRGRGALLLLAIAPTEGAREHMATDAPHGLWRVRASSSKNVRVHAWVARNDRDRGSLLRGRRSFLVDARDEPSLYLRGNRDDPGKRSDDIDDATARQGSVIRRRGSLSGMAGARYQRSIHVIAGYVLQTGDHAPYSSAGDKTSSRGVGPTAAAATDESRVLPGLRVAGAHGATLARLVGTSMAAPMYARQLAQALAGSQTQAPAFRTPATEEEEEDLFGGDGKQPVAQTPLA